MIRSIIIRVIIQITIDGNEHGDTRLCATSQFKDLIALVQADNVENDNQMFS